MRVALLHPWFLEYGGGERVLDAIAQMYPDADIYTLILDRQYLSKTLANRRIITSPLNASMALGKIGIKPRPLFMTALLPWAAESLNVEDYDLIISSCNPMLMGVNVGQAACHISYCHSPSRSWWNLYGSYQRKMPPIARQVYAVSSTYMRMWEYSAAQRIDQFIANSLNVKQRISQYYRRDSVLIYPPIQTNGTYCAHGPSDYYLSFGRFDPSKKTEIIIEACNRLGRKLLVAGSGKDEKRLKKIAGPTIEFLGRVPDEVMPQLFALCRALIFAADEDFGMVPLEVQAYGRPVIAYGHGGSLETVCTNSDRIAENTGVYFYEQTTDSLVQAIKEFESIEGEFDPSRIQSHAKLFGLEKFSSRMKDVIALSLSKKHEQRQ